MTGGEDVDTLCGSCTLFDTKTEGCVGLTFNSITIDMFSAKWGYQVGAYKVHGLLIFCKGCTRKIHGPFAYFFGRYHLI
jgi:hypothetical protein